MEPQDFTSNEFLIWIVVDVFKQPLSEILFWQKLPPLTLAKMIRAKWDQIHQNSVDPTWDFDVKYKSQADAHTAWLAQWKAIKEKEQKL